MKIVPRTVCPIFVHFGPFEGIITPLLSNPKKITLFEIILDHSADFSKEVPKADQVEPTRKNLFPTLGGLLINWGS